MLNIRSKKHAWTRSEKWLIITPALVIAAGAAFGYVKETVGTRMNWPTCIIRVPGKTNTANQLHTFWVSHDNKIIVDRAVMGILHIYNLPEGELLNTVSLFQAQLAFTGTLTTQAYNSCLMPKTQEIVYCFSEDEPMGIWNFQTATLTKRLSASGGSAAVSPDGGYLATGNYEIWDLKRNRLKHKLLSNRMFADSFPNSKKSTDALPVFSNNGQWLALSSPIGMYDSGDSGGGEVGIWDVNTGRLKIIIPSEKSTRYVFSPNATQILCREDIWSSQAVDYTPNNLTLYDIKSGRELWKCTATKKETGWKEIQFSPDGNWIAVSTRQDLVELRSPVDGSLKATLHGKWIDKDIDHASNPLPSLQFSRDGKYLVLRARQEIRIWDMSEVNARFAPGK